MERSWGVLGEGVGSKSHYSSGYHGPGATVPTGSGSYRLEFKRRGHEADLPPLSSVKVKNEWNSSTTPPCAFMSCKAKQLNTVTDPKIKFR